MTFSRRAALAGAVLLTMTGVAALPQGAVAQSSSSRIDYSYDPGGNLTGIRVAGPVTISTGGASSVPPGGQLTLTASGGSGGYVWSLETNNSGGSVTSAGVYTAGRQGGVADTVKVTDSSGAWATTSISVVSTPGTPTYASIATTSLSVNWTAAAGSTTYKLERAPDAAGSPGSWTQIASGLAALTYSDSARAANTAYWYRVRGTGAAGDGPYSAASKTMTLPNAPGRPTFTNIAQQTLTVNWTAPTRGATSYELERATASTGPWTQIAGGITALSYADSGLKTKTRYWYRVRATNALGSDGAYSATGSTTTR